MSNKLSGVVGDFMIGIRSYRTIFLSPQTRRATAIAESFRKNRIKSRILSNEIQINLK